MNRGDFARGVLKGLDAPATLHSRRAFMAWMQAEGGTVKNNPLNTTLHMPGSTRFNSADVQNYPTPQIGISAMVKTLKFKGHGYERIVKALRENASATAVIEAVGKSDWGTAGGLVFEVLDDIKKGRQSLAKLEAHEVAN
jgi:hypothetical protein